MDYRRRGPVRLMLAISLAATTASFLWLDVPYAFLCGLFFLSAFFGASMVMTRREGLRNLCLSLMVATMALFAAECWFAARYERHPVSGAVDKADAGDASAAQPAGFLSRDEWIFSEDPTHGYGPRPGGGRVQAISLHDGEIVYSVTYGVLPSGWRVTPQHPEASTAVVVFGCSFAFGEGLEDEQSFPWQLAERLGPGYQVFNFGFPGYGAHHMLSWIESGILDDIAARYSKVHVFYSTIRGHELRGLGYSQWDPYGPWYGFDKGRIVRKGVFADDISPLRPATDALFGKSLLYRKFLKTKLIPHFLRFKHHAAIIKEADRQSRRIAGAPLTAVLWPRVLFAEAIREEGVDILDLSPLFPDWENGPDKYRLHPSDGHPNALAASIVAKALADYVRSNP